ncbi:hypothetical protein Rhow_007069 [Rhodococcus wratislaviensis]|uniref:Uncharacterized protein n=1 Tax=Rhodococcus wratislaviensis TaxID=44752 RepID=A0A402CH64_RHOWR|nr:hypothetical protein Rhow_007069 [Rhodococcus wratislaviensis]
MTTTNGPPVEFAMDLFYLDGVRVRQAVMRPPRPGVIHP